MRLRSQWASALAVLVALGSFIAPMLTRVTASASTTGSGTRVYWDQNEEEDWLVHGGVQQAKPLVPPWDPNGQMCIFPDNSGRFTTGYNPTTDPTNPGFNLPRMNPPVGEAVWGVNGKFTGKTIFVPGPYANPGSSLGGDIPPDQGTGQFNNNGTFTGCVFGNHGDLFASDLGNAQGTVPPADSGRLIEWFRGTNYTSYCIVAGPTARGTGPHHVDGTGGLRQPGILAKDDQGDILVPVLGKGQDVHGEVLKYPASSLPTDASKCPGPTNMPKAVAPSVFIDSTANNQPTPQGIARDRGCGCWAVTSVLVGNAVAWYTDTGAPNPARIPVPPSPPPPISPGNNTAAGYTPYGLAFAPDGTLYFADIHITCVSPPSESNPSSALGCGPASNQGQVMRVNFLSGVPSPPVAVNTKPLNFPVGVMACTPSKTTLCPAPPGS